MNHRQIICHEAAQMGREVIVLSRLGTLEISCDAPPYELVRGGENLEFLQSPLDVRWCRLSGFNHVPRSRQNTSALCPWNWFTGRKSGSHERTCSCGQPLPVLHEVTFMTPDCGFV